MKNLEKIRQEAIAIRANIIYTTYLQVINDSMVKFIEDTLNKYAVPVIERYALEEVVNKPWKVHGENYYRRYWLIKHGQPFRAITLGKKRVQKRQFSNFDSGFSIDIKNDDLIVRHDYELNDSDSIYPPKKDVWDPNNFDEYVINGGIFAPPDYNPRGELEWLSDEEYEAYKSESNSDENRYPARDYISMAFEEINTPQMLKQIATEILHRIQTEQNKRLKQ